MATKRKAYAKFMCTACKNINYFPHKSKMLKAKEGEGKLELSRYCKHCRKHTAHKETKK